MVRLQLIGPRVIFAEFSPTWNATLEKIRYYTMKGIFPKLLNALFSASNYPTLNYTIEPKYYIKKIIIHFRKKNCSFLSS